MHFRGLVSWVCAAIAFGMPAVAQERGATQLCPNNAAVTDPGQEFLNSEPEAPGVIDGARNPEMIPQLIAYRLFLRSFISLSIPSPGLRNDEQEAVSLRKAQRKHIMHTLEFGDAEDQALEAVVRGFSLKLEKLDKSAAEVKDSAWPDPGPAAIAELEDLQQRRDDLVRQVMRSLPALLGPKAAARLDRHITENVRRQIKIFPGPVTPPARRPGQ